MYSSAHNVSPDVGKVRLYMTLANGHSVTASKRWTERLRTHLSPTFSIVQHRFDQSIHHTNTFYPYTWTHSFSPPSSTDKHHFLCHTGLCDERVGRSVKQVSMDAQSDQFWHYQQSSPSHHPTVTKVLASNDKWVTEDTTATVIACHLRDEKGGDDEDGRDDRQPMDPLLQEKDAQRHDGFLLFLFLVLFLLLAPFLVERHTNTRLYLSVCVRVLLTCTRAHTHTQSCRQVNIRRHHWLTESSSSPGECACAVMSARPWSYPRLFLRHEGVCTHCPAYLSDWFFFSYFKGPSSQMDVDSHQRFILFERHVRSSREEERRHEHARETCMSCTAPGSSRNYLLSLVGLRSAFLSIFIWLNSRSKTNVGRKNPLA